MTLEVERLMRRAVAACLTASHLDPDLGVVVFVLNADAPTTAA